MNRLFLIVLSACLLISCEKEDHSHHLIEQKLIDQSYGNDARNKLDVFLPANRTVTTPFILLIHGGGWISGDKTGLAYLQQDLMVKGIASASMNYRYASAAEIHYPQLMEDVHAAIQFCQANSSDWTIRGDKFLLGGTSAGAHMSLLYAYQFDPDNLVSGVISLCGPTDFTETTWTDHTVTTGLMVAIEALAGKPYSAPPDSAYIKISPVHGIKNIPTLMIHGDADIVVFYSQAQRLDSALENSGVIHKLVTRANTDHNLGLSDPANSQIVFKEVSDWIGLYGK